MNKHAPPYPDAAKDPFNKLMTAPTAQSGPRLMTWKNHERVELGIDPSKGAIFEFEDGSWVELIWRKSDKTLSLSADAALVIRPVASNTIRIGVER